MDYAKIKSSGPSSAPQFYPGTQPLSKVAQADPHLRAPKRTGSPKPPQMNQTGVSKCKP